VGVADVVLVGAGDQLTLSRARVPVQPGAMSSIPMKRIPLTVGTVHLTVFQPATRPTFGRNCSFQAESVTYG
jgi:hypothetical protein